PPRAALAGGPARPGGLARAAGGVGRWVKAGARQAWGACAGAVRGVRALTAGLLGWWPVVRAFRGHLLTALVIGVAGGLGAYLAGPLLASAPSAVGGFFTPPAARPAPGPRPWHEGPAPPPAAARCAWGQRP